MNIHYYKILLFFVLKRMKVLGNIEIGVVQSLKVAQKLFAYNYTPQD